MTSNSQSIPKLREVFKNHFLIGAAVNPITLKREEELIKVSL